MAKSILAYRIGARYLETVCISQFSTMQITNTLTSYNLSNLLAMDWDSRGLYGRLI